MHGSVMIQGIHAFGHRRRLGFAFDPALSGSFLFRFSLACEDSPIHDTQYSRSTSLVECIFVCRGVHVDIQSLQVWRDAKRGGPTTRH